MSRGKITYQKVYIYPCISLLLSLWLLEVKSKSGIYRKSECLKSNLKNEETFR
ncbi:unnamed protein product [Larinioides sclopetarius]|uniref:Uncharacterized protein n=1 Tax=Larinioides sclopetarius TaxID=280406 RepID=A0AAV1YUU6_9ARAC